MWKVAKMAKVSNTANMAKVATSLRGREREREGGRPSSLREGGLLPKAEEENRARQRRRIGP
jgi:hypothetical protein